MRKVIRSSQSLDNLVDKLSDELGTTFEDNIVMRYALYSEPENVDSKSQREIYNRYTKARYAYVRAVAQVIRDCDVDDFV